MQLNLPPVAVLGPLLAHLAIEATAENIVFVAEQRIRKCSCKSAAKGSPGAACTACREAQSLENLIVERLGSRCFPIIGGMLDRLSKQIKGFRGRLEEHDVAAVSNIVAHQLFLGTCNCCDDGDQLRMRRQSPCGDEHKLSSWVPGTDLNDFLKLALLNEKGSNGKFSETTPEGIRADCFNLLARRNPKDLARGMALRQVNLDIRGHSVIMGIFQIPVCDKCGKTVELDNTCACRQDGRPTWATVSELTYIIDDVAVRCHPETDESYPMYRSKPMDDGSCIHGGNKDAGGSLYFPVVRGGVASCPRCERPVEGKSSNPQLKIRQVRRQSGSDALDSAAIRSTSEKDPIERLLADLSSVTGDLEFELGGFVAELRKEKSGHGNISPETFGKYFPKLSSEAQQAIRDLCR